MTRVNYKENQTLNNNSFVLAITPITNSRILLKTKYYCPHALADRNMHIWTREKMLEISDSVTVLHVSTLPLNPQQTNPKLQFIYSELSYCYCDYDKIVSPFLFIIYFPLHLTYLSCLGDSRLRTATWLTRPISHSPKNIALLLIMP